METFHQQHLARVDRLMKIVEADSAHEPLGGLTFYDIVVFASQAMWHLKDWVLNDSHFGAKDRTSLKAEIHSSRCLLVCSDIANGSKHLSLDRPKLGGKLLERTGIHLDTAQGIFKELLYVTCTDTGDEFHGMEIRTLLRQCRDVWQDIIDRHYLSDVY